MIQITQCIILEIPNIKTWQQYVKGALENFNQWHNGGQEINEIYLKSI